MPLSPTMYSDGGKHDMSDAADHLRKNLELLPGTLTNVLRTMTECPSHASAARSRLERELHGRRVALLFGVTMSAQPGHVELGSPEGFGETKVGEYTILFPHTVYSVSEGKASDVAGCTRILLTGRALVRWPEQVGDEEVSDFRLIVISLAGDSPEKRAVVYVDIVDAEWGQTPVGEKALKSHTEASRSRVQQLAGVTGSSDSLNDGEAGICFFCGQGVAEDRASLDTFVHANVQTVKDLCATDIIWETTAIRVPRCSKCKAIHAKVKDVRRHWPRRLLYTFMLLGFILGAVLCFGAFRDPSLDEPCLFLLLGLGGPTGLGAAAGHSLGKRVGRHMAERCLKHARPPVRPVEDLSTSPIKVLLDQGWHVGKVPAEVERVQGDIVEEETTPYGTTKWRWRRALVGSNPVYVSNPHDFGVLVGICSDRGGTNFEVPPHNHAEVSVPAGRYDIFFVYSSEPDALYQGDSFRIDYNQSVTIRLERIVGGNYNIRRVRECGRVGSAFVGRSLIAHHGACYCSFLLL